MATQTVGTEKVYKHRVRHTEGGQDKPRADDSYQALRRA